MEDGSANLMGGGWWLWWAVGWRAPVQAHRNELRLHLLKKMHITSWRGSHLIGLRVCKGVTRLRHGV